MKLTFMKKLFPIASALFIFLFLLTLLKYILHHIGPHNPWMSYIYFYGLGVPIYIFTMILLIRLKAINLSYASDRFFCIVVTIGFCFLFIGHGVWTWLALNLPYKGVL